MLGCVTSDRSLLAEAQSLLDHLVANAPPEHREPVVTKVRLHRGIVKAAREAGAA